MINQFLREATEQSTTVTSLKSAGRSSTMPRNGYFKIGYQLNQTLSMNSCTFEQFKIIQEIMLLILYCNRNVQLPKVFAEYVGNASQLNSIIRNWWIPGGESLKRGRSGILHYSESDWWWIWYAGNSTRSDETKDRAMQENLETLSKYATVVQFEARSRERLAILPDTVTCSRSLQHTAYSLHWESGMYWNSGWDLLEGSLDSESATSRA